MRPQWSCGDGSFNPTERKQANPGNGFSANIYFPRRSRETGTPSRRDGVCMGLKAEESSTCSCSMASCVMG